ncbi:MAG: hypothetical protein PHI78_02320 [Clostridia bacterium]|nr:hypothetical protein [Clostridia bacterium]
MKYFVEMSDERNGLVKKMLSDEHYPAYELASGSKNISSGDALVFSPAKKWDEKLVAELPNGIFLFSGNVPDSFSKQLLSKNISHKNYLKDETFIVKNANLTAEGLLALIIENTKKSIFESSVLILGGGRVGTALAALLWKLNVKTAICEYDVNRCGGLYVFCGDIIIGEDFVRRLDEFDIIVNSIPAAVINQKICDKIPSSTVLIEAASVPCIACENVRFNYVPAPKIPQKYSAESAARLMVEFIKKSSFSI